MNLDTARTTCSGAWKLTLGQIPKPKGCAFVIQCIFFDHVEPLAFIWPTHVCNISITWNVLHFMDWSFRGKQTSILPLMCPSLLILKFKLSWFLYTHSATPKMHQRQFESSMIVCPPILNIASFWCCHWLELLLNYAAFFFIKQYS